MGNVNPSTPPDIVIEGGILLSMADHRPPVSPARILVKGDRIVAIEKCTDASVCPEAKEKIDARHGLIMPGLVNAHCHTAMTLFRGLADDLPLKEWLFEKIFPAEARYLSPETVYWGTLLGCLEMITSGTTTFLDGYFYQDSTFQAAHRAGMRGLIAQGVIDFPAPGVPDPKDNLKVGAEFLKKWSGFSETLIPGLFCHSPATCSGKTMQDAVEMSEKFGVPLQIHLSETSGEVEEIMARTGKRPVPYLEGLGILSDKLIAAHAIHLDDEEMDTLAQRGVKLVHVPQSNMKLASGAARVSQMLKRGITLGLGTDGCASNNNLDLFEEMDTAAKMDKVFTLDPLSMNAETVLRMATIRGAALLGLDKEIGSLEVGKKADIIVIDLQAPHLVPLYNPYSTLVYSANGGDVKDVVVNGKILMKDRRPLTLDPDEIMDRVTAISKGIRV